jgi:hypothetical protein
MTGRILLFLSALICACCPWAHAEQKVLMKTPVRMVTSADKEIFPDSWLTVRIAASGEELAQEEVNRTARVVAAAARKYPAEVLAANLGTVYILRRLVYFGVATGGTNSRRDIYLANDGVRLGYTDQALENAFHAEFSSILLRNFPNYLDTAAWSKANPPGFSYLGTGVEAIKDAKAGLVTTEASLADGFVYEYAKSSLENDFNALAKRLFNGDARFWGAAGQYSGLSNKTDLATAFYQRLHPALTGEYFCSLADKNSSRPAPPKRKVVPSGGTK